MLAQDQILALYDEGADRRRWQEKLRRYYRGKQQVMELMASRIDGRAKSRVVTNWTKYVIRMHAGFLLSHPVNYVPPAGAGENGLNQIRAIYQANSLEAADMAHLANAILYGYSVEVVSAGEDAPLTLRRSEPWKWTLVEEEDGTLLHAIYRTEIPKGAFFQGLQVDKDKVVYWVYDAEQVASYEETVDSQNRRVLVPLAAPKPHAWGRVPVVVFRATEDGETFLSEAFLTQCDVFDITRSSLTDDIKHNVDSLLMTKGVPYEPLLEKGKDGVSTLEKLKRIGLFPLPKDADAGYISRTVDVEKFRYDLKVTRASIHLMGAVPDLDETIGGNEGTITNISGIALKLMFHNMIQQAAEFSRAFEVGLRRRIGFLDQAAVIRGGQPVGPFAIKWNLNLPMNDTETMLAMPSLSGVVSRRDKLKILPFIEDVDRSLAELDAEAPAQG